MERIQKPLLEVSDLSVSFRMYDSGLEQKQLPVISSLSLKVLPGEILAVAGSSGSGKSLLASAILGILPGNATVSGSLRFDGEPLTPERQAKLRGTEIALVPQSVAFLDPLMKVGAQVDGHRKPRPTERRRKLFRRFGLPEQTERLYPFQLSGGMARRVLVSTALLTSARLWRALPQHEFRPIPGFQPYAGNLPSGCLFAPRCPCRTAECEKSVPPMQTVRKGEVRCFHAT